MTDDNRIDPNDPYKGWATDVDPVIHPDAKVGKDCLFHPFVTIGTMPFTYEPDKIPRVRKPVNFNTVIGDGVEIMSHSNVDLGTERDTVIGDGTKIDRGVHIAHDSIIGKHCIIVAGTIVGGFVEMGDNVYCGMGVRIIPRVKIGADAKIGAGAVVIRDVPAGQIWAGLPAKYMRERYPAAIACGTSACCQSLGKPLGAMTFPCPCGCHKSGVLCGIFVNGKPSGVPFGEALTYEQVVVLAGLASNDHPSMMYRTARDGDTQRSGALAPGGSVIPEPGMVFNVAFTGNA